MKPLEASYGYTMTTVDFSSPLEKAKQAARKALLDLSREYKAKAKAALDADAFGVSADYAQSAYQFYTQANAIK
jgi:hypothetical protein